MSTKCKLTWGGGIYGTIILEGSVIFFMDKKKKYVIGLSVIVVALVAIGISYAYWMMTFTQPEKNVVTLDCFKVTFTGENDINLINAYPMQDDELYDFYKNATPYHFTITNVCESPASGVINLETLSSTKKLPDDYVDVILYDGTKNYLDIAKAKSENTDVYSKMGEGREYNDINIYDNSLMNNLLNSEKVLTEALKAHRLHKFTLGSLESKEFHLLEYMSPDTPPVDEAMNATFESKITVTAYHNEIPESANILRKRERCNMESGCTNIDKTRVFQDEYINNATSIVFENTTVAPTTYVACFDESEARNGSIMAYVVANESDASKYTIRFQTEGTYLMPSDSSFYFLGFYNVTSLEGLENVDTSKVTDMSYMFLGCGRFTSLDLSNFDTSHVTNMSYMFAYFNDNINLDLSSFDTSNVTNMSYMFAQSVVVTPHSLSESPTSRALPTITLNLSSFNTSKVTDMSYMFHWQRFLVSLDLSSFDTSNVINMSNMFVHCETLRSLNLSGFNTSKVTNMSSMFDNCMALTSLDVSNFDTRQVTDMSFMFNHLGILPSLNVSHFDTSKVMNMSSMFRDCWTLTSIDVSHFDTSNVTDMATMFGGCESLTSLNLSNFNTSQVTDMSSMFGGCESLTSLNLSNFNTSQVTDMSGMFSYCTILTSLDISSFDTRKVTNMSGMFHHVEDILSLDLSSFDTSQVTSMNSMFEYTYRLSTILYGTSFIRKSGLDMDYMFYYCDANKPTDPSWDGAF